MNETFRNMLTTKINRICNRFNLRQEQLEMIVEMLEEEE